MDNDSDSDFASAGDDDMMPPAVAPQVKAPAVDKMPKPPKMVKAAKMKIVKPRLPHMHAEKAKEHWHVEKPRLERLTRNRMPSR
jgi:hypothetical protein